MQWIEADTEMEMEMDECLWHRKVFRVLGLVRKMFIYMGNDLTKILKLFFLQKNITNSCMSRFMLRGLVLPLGPRQNSMERLEVPTAAWRAVGF